MHIIIISFLLLNSQLCYSQRSLDTRINVTVTDTNNLYEKVRLAFVHEDFIVKDDRRYDTLTTYPMNIGGTSFIRSFAAISNNQVTFWGYVGDSDVNILGYTVNPSKGDFKKIFYYKTDKYWRKLQAIANRVGGEYSYGKEN